MYIPVHLCAYALKHMLVSEFRLLIYLKYQSTNGNLFILKEQRMHIANDLNLDEKTIAIQLKKLIKLKWLSKNSQNYYFVRGFNYLNQITSSYRPIFYLTRVEFSFKYLDVFRAYLAGAIFGYFINDQIRKEFNKKKEGLENASSLQSTTYYPLALSALNKLLDIGISTLQKYRIEAVDNNFISFSGEQLYHLSTTVQHKDQVKKFFPEFDKRIIVRENNLFIQKPNCYSANLHFQRGTNYVTY